MISSKAVLECDQLQELAELLAHKIAKKYRVELPRALAMVVGYFEKKTDLCDFAQQAPNIKAIRRTRLYKEAERETTRRIYYDLRRYHGPDDIASLVEQLSQASTPAQADAIRLALVKNHVSTAERFAHAAQFWQTIIQHWGQPSSVLDVGCGILPLLLPFDEIALDQYVALDRSLESINTINGFQQAYNVTQLKALQWSIDQGWSATGLDRMYDVAFLFKLVPVVARQEPGLLAILAQTPAKRLIVTGCRTAMVKQQDISRRESAIIIEFAEQAQWQLCDTFDTPDEIGFVFTR